MSSFLSLVGWLAACFATAAVGGIATSTSVSTWYQGLNKPSWNPPSWVFGPVWTLLYILMAVAMWLVWRTDSPNRTPAATLFVIQLILNALWSWLFFGWRMPGAAAVEIVVLWVVIAATTLIFARTSGVAAALMLPYLVWVAFASVLNFTIWRLNQ